jgi:3-dehydroquinate synthetase
LSTEGFSPLQEIIKNNISVKAEIVMQDEKEM